MWILDSASNLSKLSPIQVVILMDCAQSGSEPRKITDIMKALENRFKDLWTPKKGTIYPSVHNLSVRGYLKAHAIKPYGFSITKKGLKTLTQLLANLNKQMEVDIEFFRFLIEGATKSEISDKSVIETIIQEMKSLLKDTLKEIK